MNRFNEYMANHFGSCRLLAHAQDLHRNRMVKIYQVPGHMDVCGVTDGVEAWIAPVSPNLFSVNVARLYEDIAAGRPIDKPTMVQGARRPRVKLHTDEPSEPIPTRKPRVQLHS